MSETGAAGRAPEGVTFLIPCRNATATLGATLASLERQVVDGFARTLVELRPEFKAAHLATPVSMLLFGMINWMFTWMNPQGRWDHDTMAPIVSQLFLWGLQQLHAPEPSKQGQLA